MSKIFNFLWYKVLSTQISHSQVKNCDRQLETKKILVLYKEKNRKMPIKSVKIKISKNEKMSFYLIIQCNNKVPKSKCVLCSPRTDTHARRGHPLMVSGFFPSTYHQGSAQHFCEEPFELVSFTIKSRQTADKSNLNILASSQSDQQTIDFPGKLSQQFPSFYSVLAS